MNFFWFMDSILWFINFCIYLHSPDLVSYVDAAAAQAVDIFFAFVHEATDQPVVAEDDAGHLGDILVTLVLTDVNTVIHQAGHQVAPPSLHLITLLYLKVRNIWQVRGEQTTDLKLPCRVKGRLTSVMVLLQISMATDSNFGSVVRLSL